MRERDEHDAGDRSTTERPEPFARDEVEDVFAGGRVDPSVVEASVDALFERFEEDTPEEVMLADRYPSEHELLPTPPAFDEFAADVDERVPERTSGDDVAILGSGDDRLPEHASDEAGPGGGDAVPDPDDVVGFEDAPEPSAEDAREPSPADDPDASEGAGRSEASWSTETTLSGVDEWSPAERSAAARAADPETDDAFEWVSEPVGSESVSSETVLADPERARSFAGERAGEDRADGVLSRLRSSFPF